MANIRLGLRLLETLTSALYEDPIVLFREYIQNSVDAYTDAIRYNEERRMDDFHVDISIDREGKNIIFFDNGYGIANDEFVSKMKSIGDSQKGFHNDQIGFRGIGRLSAMPFCDSLEFHNKTQGSSKLQTFRWEGRKYAELLSKEDCDLDEAIDAISAADEQAYEGNTEAHFFKVIITEYHTEISELLEAQDFIQKLSLMLPLRYSPSFTNQEKIKQEYEKIMNKSLDDLAYDIRLDGTLLYKPYEDRHILEAGIVFWPLQFKAVSENVPAEKIGLLWFTFNRRVTANPTSEPRGIMARSKNMLVGNSDSLADAVSVNSSDYVATYRELTQSLSGVYGEMLLYASSLEDNARRDWFKISASSIELRGIIAEFLRRLIAYRYAASKAFNDKPSQKKKENLRAAYTDLTQGITPETFLSNFYAREQTDDEADKPIFEFADDDIPRASITIKKFYDKALTILRDFYSDEDNLTIFFKVRAHLKKRLNEETKN